MSELNKISKALEDDGWTKVTIENHPDIPYFAIIGMSPEQEVLSASDYSSIRVAYDKLIEKRVALGATEEVNV